MEVSKSIIFEETIEKIEEETGLDLRTEIDYASTTTSFYPTVAVILGEDDDGDDIYVDIKFRCSDHRRGIFATGGEWSVHLDDIVEDNDDFKNKIKSIILEEVSNA